MREKYTKWFLFTLALFIHTNNGQFVNNYGQQNQNQPPVTDSSGRFNTDFNSGRQNPNPYANDNNFNSLDNDFDRSGNNRFRTENDITDNSFSRRPSSFDNYGGGKSSYNVKTSFLETVFSKEPTYFIVASRMVRPGLIYQVAVNVLHAAYPITVHASISKDGVEISGDFQNVKEGVPETLLMRIPPTSVYGNYKLRVEGLYNHLLGGIAFLNETQLVFSQRSMTIFIQTDKPLYKQGEMVNIRAIPITTELKGFDNAIDVYMLDPTGHILRRWLSRQSNLGSVNLEYKLSEQPKYGEWTIRVIAQGQVEESHFSVEEYYQTRFEVNVTMPAFFFNTDQYIYGRVMANFTSGAPVQGNLTLRATISPIGFFNAKAINEKYRIGRVVSEQHVENSFLYNQRYQPHFNNRDRDRGYQPGGFQQGPQAQPNPGQQNDIDQQFITNNFQNQYVFERNYNFDEKWPFWIEKPLGQETYDPVTAQYVKTLPYLRFFNGTFDFKFPMVELERYMPNHMEGMEVMITATVGEKFYDEVLAGYSIARVYNSSIRVLFLGESPQVFKPTMPFTCYIAVEYHDGSPIQPDLLTHGLMEVTGSVESKAGRRDFPSRRLRMSQKNGIWELPIDLRNELALGDGKSGREFLNGIQSMRLRASFQHARGDRAETELLLLSHYSSRDQHIKVSTSTKEPKVGEYIIFHIRTNFFMETFNYLIMSKGVILMNDQETITENIRTVAVTLSAEMAPVATIVVWKITAQGQVVADSLTFPVNGISRNNFTVYINNHKARTGEKVEVAIFGEPGSYVGLSGIDNAFYTMQAGNELSYAKVITAMATFDEQTNGTHKHEFYSHEGTPDDLIFFPASTFGVDANRTFEYSGLVVFTDVLIPRRQLEVCNATLGYGECLNGKCYRLDKRCDGYNNCDDGSDEIGCRKRNETDLMNFRKYRFNRVQRHYDNVWLWKGVNIGPHGRNIFNIDVPDGPAYWMVSAFSVSPSKGLGMINKAIQYAGVQPFFINVEMPTMCMQGEQVGIRVTVFNYMTVAIEATVVLHGSPDYKFVHVEENGIVRSYNPRVFGGDHQFFIYMEAQGSKVVYLPIVPQRLGDIDVTLHAATLLGTDTIVRRIHVESDGVPQYRHQSILLDLSSRAYVFQYMHVNITEFPIIPYQVERYFVYGSNKARLSVVGDVVGPIFPTMPVNATSLLYLPMESAEQNMFSFAANLFTVMYMRLINQRNKTIEKHAFHHMNEAYQRQLSYLKEDGSFSLFRSDWNNSDSSVWLTAYCARILQESSFYEWENFIYIDPNIIKRNVRWLLQHQSDDGAFYEVTWLPDRKMNKTGFNDEYGQLKQKNISLTAHVLITLATVKDLSGELGTRVSLAQKRALQFIERNMRLLQTTTEPYEVAIVAYALLLCKSPISGHVFSILSKHARVDGEFMYWGNKEILNAPSKLENQKYFSLPRLPYEHDALNIETTAYALLVYVSRREYFVDPIVRWLNSQRLNDGGWASTQDTSVALKALIEYTVHTRIRDVSSLQLTIEATSLPGQTKYLSIDDKNLGSLQSIEIPNAWGTVKVQAKGAGFAILQMHVQYNVDIDKFQTKPPIPSYELDTRAIFHGRNQSHISYLACQRWTNFNESQRSGMSVLDVTIPTGYFMQQQKLDSYVLSRRVRNLQRAKYQERKVLFFFEYLDTDSICVNFTVERWHPVANMSRYLPIRVYDYYAPERFNESIFDALPTYLLNICEVCGSSQCPYCSIYNLGWKASASLTLMLSCFVLYFLRHRTFSIINLLYLV